MKKEGADVIGFLGDYIWIIMAVLSCFFAGLTSILAKCGLRKMDSDIAMALRTIIVLLFAWGMVFVVGEIDNITLIETESLVLLILSGMATGASWICYFKALSVGDINKVVPIDKSSTILAMLLAIILFGETDGLGVKLFGIILFGIGLFLMIENKNNSNQKKRKRRWFPYAVGSSIFAALTSILAKIGISSVESNLATAIRTCVVLVMAWLIVFLKGKQKKIKGIDKKEIVFIILSGIATGASWLCYYYAIQNGEVSIVVPIDKMSILVSVIFSAVIFHETIEKKQGVGLLLMLGATLLITLAGM